MDNLNYLDLSSNVNVDALYKKIQKYKEKYQEEKKARKELQKKYDELQLEFNQYKLSNQNFLSTNVIEYDKNNKSDKELNIKNNSFEMMNVSEKLSKSNFELRRSKSFEDFEEEKFYFERNKLVKFNVGGIKYVTTCGTIFMRGENFLTLLVRHFFSSKKMSSTLDDEGYLFIDRNGRIFEIVLDFLRTSFVSNPQDIDKKQIEKEFQFYQIKIPEDKSISINTLQNIIRESEPMKEAEKFLQCCWEEIEECIRRRAIACEESYRLTCSKYWYKLAEVGNNTNVEVGLKNKFKFNKQISLDKTIRCVARLIKKKYGLKTSVSTQRWEEAQRTDFNLDIDWTENELNMVKL